LTTTNTDAEPKRLALGVITAESPPADAASDRAAARSRHRELARRALLCGRGVHWASDITTLPLSLVARVAAEAGISDPGAEDALPRAAQWPPVALLPGRRSRPKTKAALAR
jgi:hypothetical protein